MTEIAATVLDYFRAAPATLIEWINALLGFFSDAAHERPALLVFALLSTTLTIIFAVRVWRSYFPRS